MMTSKKSMDKEEKLGYMAVTPIAGATAERETQSEKGSDSVRKAVNEVSSKPQVNELKICGDAAKSFGKIHATAWSDCKDFF